MFCFVYCPNSPRVLALFFVISCFCSRFFFLFSPSCCLTMLASIFPVPPYLPALTPPFFSPSNHLFVIHPCCRKIMSVIWGSPHQPVSFFFPLALLIPRHFISFLLNVSPWIWRSIVTRWGLFQNLQVPETSLLCTLLRHVIRPARLAGPLAASVGLFVMPFRCCDVWCGFSPLTRFRRWNEMDKGSTPGDV